MALQHTVLPGECLAKIASRYGFADPQTILDDPANAELAAARNNPNVLRPGDVITIPEPRREPVSIATGRRHTCQVKLARKQLRLVLRDHEGQPIANAEYELRVGEETRVGSTDGDGLLRERIGASVTQVELELLGRVLTLRLGLLDPLLGPGDPGYAIGVQARLRNLGYDPGPTDGIFGRRTRAALASFQADHGLSVDGVLGEQTRTKLEEVHGC